jgi:hypothetical protein
MLYNLSRSVFRPSLPSSSWQDWDQIIVFLFHSVSLWILLRHRWEDNIKMDLTEIGLEGVDWSGSGYRPVVGSYDHSNEPLGSIKGGKFLDQLSILLASQEGLCSMALVIPTVYISLLSEVCSIAHCSCSSSWTVWLWITATLENTHWDQW